MFSLKYCIEIESGQSNDISLLRKLCLAGLPYRDIESFDQETLNSVYESYEKMKELLNEWRKFIAEAEGKYLWKKLKRYFNQTTF